MRKSRFFRHVLPLAALLLLCAAHTAQAQCRGGMSNLGTSPMCPPDPPPDRIVVEPIIDPAYQVLQGNIKIYNDRFGGLYENSRALERFTGLPAPVSEDELSRRIDDVFAAAWPEYRTNALQAELYRRQTAFYEKHNAVLQKRVAGMKDSLAAARAGNPGLATQAQQAEEALVKSRAQEAELTRIGFAQMNSHDAQRLAMAYILIFTPDAPIKAHRLDSFDYYRGDALPNALPPPLKPLSAMSPAASEAEEAPPKNLGEMKVSLPASGAPLQEKFAAMQSMSLGMQQDRNDLIHGADRTTSLQSEYNMLRLDSASVVSELAPLLAEQDQLKIRLAHAREGLDVSTKNSESAARSIMGEIVVDMALDHASGKMKEIVEEIVGAEGLADKLPEDKADAVIKMAQEGGKVLLTRGGFEKQWDAFMETQKQTLDVLDRMQNYMQEAARLAASGTPEEMEEHLDRVFASVKWQSAEYAKTAGWSVMPEGEEGSAIGQAFEKYLAKLKAKETGAGE